METVSLCSDLEYQKTKSQKLRSSELWKRQLDGFYCLGAQNECNISAGLTGLLISITDSVILWSAAVTKDLSTAIFRKSHSTHVFLASAVLQMWSHFLCNGPVFNLRFQDCEPIQIPGGLRDMGSACGWGVNQRAGSDCLRERPLAERETTAAG